MTKAFKILDLAQICTRVKSEAGNQLVHYIKLPSFLAERLSPAQLAVLFALASFKPAGELIQASISEISECSGVCRKVARRTIGELEYMTLISVQKKSGFPNAYVFHGFER